MQYFLTINHCPDLFSLGAKPTCSRFKGYNLLSAGHPAAAVAAPAHPRESQPPLKASKAAT